MSAVIRSEVIELPAADKILADLEAAEGEWVCGVTRWARERYILSFAQRISIDLRGKRGLPIESAVCTLHEHKKARGCRMYRLPLGQLRLVMNA